MKLINKIFLGTAALSLMAGFQSCNDDDETTLEGAKTVYIEITPNDIQLQPGDQMALSARVTNGSGDVIDTPVKWSVVDTDVAEIIPVYEQVTEEIPVPSEGEEGGEEGDENSTESKAEGDTDPVEGDDEPETITVTRDGDFLYFAVRALKGSQGRQTLVRAELEDGRYAVAPVNVLAGSISGALTMLTTDRRSYADDGFDTVWVKVNPISLLDDCKLTYSVEFEKVYAEDVSESAGKFTFNEGLDIVYGRDVYDKIPYCNTASGDKPRTEMLDWVGVVYRAPRMAGEAIFTVTLSDEESSESVDTKILVAPKITPGWTYNGVRPGWQEENPSNIKHTLINVVMDVNSSFTVEACLGVYGQQHIEDIDNAIACEKAGLYKFDVTGSAVLVKDMFIDRLYDPKQEHQGGYVSCMTVESGIREGLATVTFTLPDMVMTCNITVENFATAHPVEGVIFRELSYDPGDGELVTGEIITERTFVINDKSIGTIEVLVDPEDANDYHSVEVTSSDPSIISVDPVGLEAGYNRSFTAHKPGTVTITGTSLGKSNTFIAHSIDRVLSISLSSQSKVNMGDELEIFATVGMQSGVADWIPQCTFTVSDESVATIKTVPGDPTKAILTPVSVGEVSISATCDDKVAEPITVTILEGLQNAEYTNDNIGEALVEFSPENDGEFFFGITSQGGSSSNLLSISTNLEREEIGEWESDDVDVLYNGVNYSGCKVNLTFTIDEDDEELIHVSGTIILNNGVVITINLTAEYSVY